MSKPRDLKGFGGGGPSRAVSLHVFMSAVFLFLTIATFLILAAANQTAALWATSGILAGAPAGWIFGSVESRWIASDLLTAELSKAGRRRFLLNFACAREDLQTTGGGEWPNRLGGLGLVRKCLCNPMTRMRSRVAG